MTSRTKALGGIVRIGMKYAPLAYVGFRRGRGPAQELASRQMAKRNAHSAAVEHASHLIDGSILPVYAGDTRVWVVFSGDLPVGSHPVVTTPLVELLRHYDLTKRTRPADLPSAPTARWQAGRRWMTTSVRHRRLPRVTP